MSGFLPPKPDAGSDEPRLIRQHAREIASAVRVVMQGGLNTVYEVELSTGTSTVVTDARLTVAGAGLLDPVTASAAALIAAGTVYILAADRLPGAWTITHPAGAAGRTFRMLMIG